MADGIFVRVEGLDQILRRFDQLRINVPRLVAAAANSTAKHAKTLVTRDVMSRWNLTSKKTVLDTMTITQATQARPSAEVKMTSRGISLTKFGMRRVPIKLKTKPKVVVTVKNGRVRRKEVSRSYKRYGVQVALLRGQAPAILPHAFPATMPSGHRGAFLRRGTTSLPIFEKKSISAVAMWGDYLEKHVRELSPYLRARIIGQLEARLRKAGG
jgi:hypothetical protein